MSLGLTTWLSVSAAAALLCAGCAKGSTAEPFTLPAGLYELSTVQLAGECKLDDAVSPGAEHVGKVVRAQLTATATSVRLELCDDFLPDTCLPAAGDPLTFIREDHLLLADEPNWTVPCGCFGEYTAARRADGKIVADGLAELTWTFELPPVPGDCAIFCPGYQSCSATVSQRLVSLQPEQ